MAYQYSIYQHRLISDVPLYLQDVEGPDTQAKIVFQRAPGDAFPDVSEKNSSLVHRVPGYTANTWLKVYELSTGDVILEYMPWRFWMRFAEQEIVYSTIEVPSPPSLELAIDFFVMPIFMLFSNRSVLAVHGSAVAMDGHAWLFIGSSGAGKSTTAHILTDQGATLLSDDMTLINAQTHHIYPGTPSLRLWKNPGEVSSAVQDLPVSDISNKRWIRLHDHHGSAQCRPLKGIVWLDPATGHEAKNEISPFTGRAAMVELLRQTFDFTAPSEDWAIRRFKNAQKIFSNVPLYRYSYQRSSDGRPTHVERLVQFITRHHELLNG